MALKAGIVVIIDTDITLRRTVQYGLKQNPELVTQLS